MKLYTSNGIRVSSRLIVQIIHVLQQINEVIETSLSFVCARRAIRIGFVVFFVIPFNF